MKSYTEFREAKDDYTLYHNSLTSAIREVDQLLKRRGFAMDPDDSFDQIGLGPAKPSKGKTNKYNIMLRKKDKDGPLTKKRVHIQVYNRGVSGNTFELNTYIS